MIAAVAEILGRYTFRPVSEKQLQAQVAAVLQSAGLEVSREVPSEAGRYDLVVMIDGKRLVLELKLSASAPAVERQAQGYALVADVDEVAVVTTSSRLASEIARANATELGGKPFGVVVLRSF